MPRLLIFLPDVHACRSINRVFIFHSSLSFLACPHHSFFSAFLQTRLIFDRKFHSAIFPQLHSASFGTRPISQLLFSYIFKHVMSNDKENNSPRTEAWKAEATSQAEMLSLSVKEIHKKLKAGGLDMPLSQIRLMKHVFASENLPPLPPLDVPPFKDNESERSIPPPGALHRRVGPNSASGPTWWANHERKQQVCKGCYHCPSARQQCIAWCCCAVIGCVVISIGRAT